MFAGHALDKDFGVLVDEHIRLLVSSVDAAGHKGSERRGLSARVR